MKPIEKTIGVIRSALDASDCSASETAWVRPEVKKRARQRKIWLKRGGVVALIALGLWLISRLPHYGYALKTGREFPCDPVFFYQEDAAWKDDAMGDSGKTLGKDGDTVACLASIIAMQRLPFPGEVNPGTVNAWLVENDGYDGEGNIRWEPVAALLNARACAFYSSSMGPVLEDLIQREIYAIAQVKRPDVGRMHDVLVVGSVHGEFRIVDPLDPTDLMNTMGIYHNRAYGLRYLVPNDTGE